MFRTKLCHKVSGEELECIFRFEKKWRTYIL